MLSILDLNFLAIISSLLLAAGVFTVALGLRRRRRGLEPHCRKCEYDLTGVPHMRCPECGADVSTAAGTVIGQRVRKRGTLFLGAFLLLIGGGVPFAAVMLLSRGFNIYTSLPNFVLLAEADGHLGTASMSGLDELHRRLRAGRLPESDVQRLAQIGLSEQKRAALRGRYSTRLLDLLGTLRADGHISDATWDQVLETVVTVRPLSVRSDNDGRRLILPFELRGPLWLRGECSLTQVDIDGARTLLPGSGMVHSRGGRAERLRLRLPDDDREHVLHLIIDWALEQATNPSAFATTFRTVRAWRQEMRLTIVGDEIRDQKISARERVLDSVPPQPGRAE